MKTDKYHVELTPELIKRAQERIDFILIEGCKVPGITDTFDTNTKPEWYDEDRFKKAQQIAREYLVTLGNSSLIGLLLVLQLPIGLLPLLATGQSKNVSKLFSRYLNTILHVNAWYKHDPFDPESKAYKSQKMVKTMHQNAGKLMNSKISVYEFTKRMLDEQYKKDEINNNNVNSEKQDIDNNNIESTKEIDHKPQLDIETIIKSKDRTWVSQADESLTQWAFIGVLILEPLACGLHGGSKEKLVEIAYLWRVFGYKIGIEDRFNLFNDLEFDLLYAICKLVFEQAYLPYLEHVSSPVGLKMTRGTTIGLKPLLPYVRWRSYIKYWYKILNVNAYKLNQMDLNTDKYEFVCYPIKTELSEDEKKLMINNGYNTKYIVPNPHIPFEELKLDTFSEKFFYNFFLLNVNLLFKSHFVRNVSRKTTKGRANRALKNKKHHIEYMKKNYDETNQYPACPFAGEIQNNYFEFTEVTK